MRIASRILGLLVASLAACSHATEPRLLTSKAAYSGPIHIEARVGDATRSVTGTLRFDRATGDVELLRDDGTRLTKSGPDGALKKTHGEAGVPVPVSADDVQDFNLALTAIFTAPGRPEDVETLPDGYAYHVGDQHFTVRFAAPGGG